MLKSKLRTETLCWCPSGFRDTGCLPLPKKIRTFQLKCKWQGYFGLPDRKISEKNGTSSEVVQNSQREYPNGKCAFHLLFSSSSRPFGLYSSRWRCPWKWNTPIPKKFPFRILMRPIYCHFRPTGVSDPNGKQPLTWWLQINENIWKSLLLGERLLSPRELVYIHINTSLNT